MKPATASKWTESCTPGFCRANEDDSRKSRQVLINPQSSDSPLRVALWPALTIQIAAHLDAVSVVNEPVMDQAGHLLAGCRPRGGSGGGWALRGGRCFAVVSGLLALVFRTLTARVTEWPKTRDPMKIDAGDLRGPLPGALDDPDFVTAGLALDEQIGDPPLARWHS
jgi:hypothetical protein